LISINKQTNKMDAYEVIKCLHSSSHSTVQLARHKQSGDQFVLKILSLPSEDEDSNDEKSDVVVVALEDKLQVYEPEDSLSDNDVAGDVDDDEYSNETNVMQICVESEPSRQRSTAPSESLKEEEDTPVLSKKVKQFEKERDAIKAIQQEIMVMQQLKDCIRLLDAETGHEGHRYVVQVHEIIEDIEQNAIVLVQEHVSGGDLFGLVQEGRIPIDKVKRYFRQMCLGLQFLHSCGIAHRDIKLENILIDREMDICRIADYGAAGIMFSKGKRRKKLFNDIVGTFPYLSPEQHENMIFGGGYDGEEVDVWQLGCCLYIMLTGASPFESNADEEEDEPSVIRERILKLQVNYNYSVFSKQPAAKLLLSQGMLVKKDQRYSLQQILDSEWLSTVGNG